MHRIASALIAATVVLFVACGSDTASQKASQATAPSGTSSAAGAAATTTTAQPKGELRIASSSVQFPRTFDVAKDGYSLVFLGAGEMLTRLTRDQKVEPWLAERVTQVDPTTWRVVLRRNAKFHDGTPVTAEEVAASFRRAWEQQPAANRFIAKETQVTVVDPLTLDFKTPQPAGGFPNNLATQQFIVAKPGPNGSILTGSYRPVQLQTDTQLTLEAFTDHWAGPPPISKITVRVVADDL